MNLKDFNAPLKYGATVSETELSVADGKYIVGDSNGKGAEVSLSGDVTSDNAGVVTIGANKIKQSQLAYETASVTVSAAATSGTATVTSGNIIIGYYPTSNQDQFVDSIAIASTTLTVTLAAAATADNVFTVVMLKA